MSGRKPAPALTPLSKGRRFVVVFCALGLVYAIFEASIFGGLLLLSRWKDIRYTPVQTVLTAQQRSLLRNRLETYKRTGRLPGHHPILGWIAVRSSSDGLYRLNNQGIRADKDFSIRPHRLLRIAAFGDSFTAGDTGISNEDTWEEQLSRAGQNIEVLNFGVGGYGLDQAYLRYLVEGKTYQPDLVLIGFMSENIFRNVNVFRPFYDKAYAANLLTKPRFILEGDHLVLLENPLKTIDDFQRFLDEDRKALLEFGKNDYHYHKKYQEGALDFVPSIRAGKMVSQTLRAMKDRVITVDGFYNTRSEAFNLTDRIFDEFYRAALMNDSLPVIVVFPDIDDLKSFPQRHTLRYQPLLDRFESKRYRYVDSMAAFIQNDPAVNWKDLTVDRWGHYSFTGNKLVAEFLAQYLDKQGLTSREVVKLKVMEERVRLQLQSP